MGHHAIYRLQAVRHDRLDEPDIDRYDESLRLQRRASLFSQGWRIAIPQGGGACATCRRNEAETCWKHILELGRPQKLYNIEPGIFSHLTRHNLAIIAEERGDHADAKTYWRAILEECPEHAEALKRLVSVA